MIVIILTSMVLLWLNICKIGNSNFGHKIIHPKTEKTTKKQQHLNINSEFSEANTISQKKNKITSANFRKETSKTRNSYRKGLLKIQNLELLEKFLEQLKNFKHFNKDINQFENLNINIGPNQNKNLSQENICFAILSFFLYEVCTNRDFIDTTPQIFYKPFNQIIFNNNERLKRFNYPKFKQKYINDTGVEHFRNSEFYKELLVHYKNSPKM
ncbi:hypothetical protein [Maribacter sp. 1_MG-2023]|uniref:hypothetical protein n=1 Tax=Maribacter sp. 1_MG-2023 TaxID=3062677 RepID=UPI0026E42FB7|nr:hypothetical protein [Maribacter sp. 1_MG-2023]